MSYRPTLTLNSEDREQYRQYVASLDVPTHEIDALIDIVHSILSYFVDQAFNVQTDQITLQSIGNISFNAPLGHATIANHPDNQTAHVQGIGVESDSNPVGPTEP